MDQPSSLSRRHHKLTIDPEHGAGGGGGRRQSAEGLFNTKSKSSFTAEQVAECRELFQIFDKSLDTNSEPPPPKVCKTTDFGLFLEALAIVLQISWVQEVALASGCCAHTYPPWAQP